MREKEITTFNRARSPRRIRPSADLTLAGADDTFRKVRSKNKQLARLMHRKRPMTSRCFEQALEKSALAA
jgi:hypothetical protein